MEKIIIDKETKALIEAKSDRELQNSIYRSLLKIEVRQEQSVSILEKSLAKLSVLANIAIFTLICSLLAVLMIVISFNK
jgi:hypothetical protein